VNRVGGGVSRLSLVGFGALVVATIAAFFITQHLKVTTPLIANWTYDRTPHNIVPTNPRCNAVTIYFHLLHRADSIDIYIVDHSRRLVRTLARDVPAQIKQPLQYTWNGRLDDGTLAPQGLYNFGLHLIHQHRTIDPVNYGFPISVQSTCPLP
jgi:hypothetical protein